MNRIAATLEQPGPIEGKEDFVAQHRKQGKKNKRQWGSGSIIREKLGLAIRWSETVIGSNGKRRRKMKYEFLGDVSERKAERTLTDRIAETNRRGVVQEKIVPTFFDHTERWKRDVLSNFKHSTQVGHTSILKTVLVPQFGPWRVSDITPIAAQEFFSKIRSGYALESLRHFREVFRAVMEDARTWYGLDHNPAAGIKLPKRSLARIVKPPRKKWALTEQQAGALIGAITTIKPRVMVLLALITGMRRGELLACRWRSIDASASHITVTEASYLGQLDTPKTGEGKEIPLDPVTLGQLQEWRRQSKRSSPDDFIFGTRLGKLENPNNILRRHIYPACDRLGLPRANWLTFRRTFQTWAHVKGIPARTIADIVGHVNVETQFIYVQPMDGAKKEAVQKIAEDLHRSCPDRSQMNIPFDPDARWVN